MTYSVKTKETMDHEDTIAMLLRDALFSLSTMSPLNVFIKIDSIWVSIPDQFKKGKLKDLDPYVVLGNELGTEDYQEIRNKIRNTLLPYEVDDAENEEFFAAIRKVNRKLIMDYETCLFDMKILMKTKTSFITGMKENIGDIKEE